MNDPEVNMSKAVSNIDLVAYASAKEVDSHLRLLAGRSRKLVRSAG